MKLSWWSAIPTYFDGIAISLGSFEVHWYGVMYLFAFATAYAVMYLTIRKENFWITKEQLDSFMTWLIIGVVVGARLGYVLIYNPGHYLSHPLEIVWPFRSTPLGTQFVGIAGMSYHGGLVGAVLGALYAIWKHKMPLRDSLNLGFYGVPLGYTFGRWGNFINGELYGEVTTSPIGMWFPNAHDSLPNAPILHHPSQLYEMCFEGVILFLILYALRKREFFRHQMMSCYLMGYGLFRFFIEFFRKPDAHLGRADLFGMSRGQTLCSLMIIAGIVLFIWNYKIDKKVKTEASAKKNGDA